jgi:site-specific recombinase XerC
MRRRRTHAGRCRGRTGAPCQRFGWWVSPARPPNRTCDHPHALRHTFGTGLAEAGVDLPVIQELLGHAHVDSSVGYIHLAPVRVRAAFDQARERQRGRG